MGMRRVNAPATGEALGRCHSCRRAYCWARKTHRNLTLVRCPKCGGPLSQTTWQLRSVSWFNITARLDAFDTELKKLHKSYSALRAAYNAEPPHSEWETRHKLYTAYLAEVRTIIGQAAELARFASL